VTGEGESRWAWCSGASPVAHLLAHPLVLPPARRANRVPRQPASAFRQATAPCITHCCPASHSASARNARWPPRWRRCRGRAWTSEESRRSRKPVGCARANCCIRSGEAFDRDVHGRTVPSGTQPVKWAAVGRGSPWLWARPCAGIGEAQVRSRPESGAANRRWGCGSSTTPSRWCNGYPRILPGRTWKKRETGSTSHPMSPLRAPLRPLTPFRRPRSAPRMEEPRGLNLQHETRAPARGKHFDAQPALGQQAGGTS